MDNTLQEPLRKRSSELSKRKTDEKARGDGKKKTTLPKPVPKFETISRKIWEGSRTCCKVILYLFCGFIVIPALLNYSALQKEENELNLPGLKYDIGNGQKLYLNCNGTGFPTVLLDASTGKSTEDWYLVSSSLAKITKVCTYDRAGLGFSDSPVKKKQPEGNSATAMEEFSKTMGIEEYTVDRMADEVKSLIDFSSQQVQKPFIYVGAELGGLVARYYAAISDNSISDLVLINPLTEELFQHDDGIWEDFWYQDLIGSHRAVGLAVACGLTRLGLIFGLLAPPMKHVQNESLHARQKHLMCNTRHVFSAVNELYYTNRSFAQIRTLFRAKEFPNNIPVTFLQSETYDYNLPQYLNTAWREAVTATHQKYHSAAAVIELKERDRNVLHTEPLSVVKHLKQIVLNRRHQNTNSKAS